MTETTDILIVGAGPTGLTLACLLARQGVRFRIIDAADAPPIGSRGKGLQPRSLEMFDDLGIVARIVANGMFDLPIQYYDEDGRATVQNLHAARAARPDAPYQSPLVTPQWRVEEALRDRLAELGAQVEFGTALEDFTQDDDGVTAQLSGGAQVKARLLVGCDGGKSVVRHQAEISFLGETLENFRMMVGDVRVTGLDRAHWHIWKSGEGFAALCPLPSTDAFQFQASVAPGQESAPSLEAIRRMVAQRTGRDDIIVEDASWLSLWRANVRMVDRYRAGRVFVAGDAAHVHSPAGGQGMNTGIQDACNLGWKLGAVLRGADAALLATYEEERLPVAAGVLGLSNELMMSTVNKGTIAFQRDDKTLQLGIGYRGAVLSQDMRGDGSGLRAGDRAPDAPGLAGPSGTLRLFDLLRGPHVTVLGFGAGWQPVIDACTARSGGQVRGYVIVDAPGDPRHLVDTEGHARAAYAPDALFVIRPDNYVGMVADRTDSAAIADYLEKIGA